MKGSLGAILIGLLSGLAQADDFLDPLVGNWRVSGQTQGQLVSQQALVRAEAGGVRLQMAEADCQMVPEGKSYRAYRRTPHGTEESQSYLSGGYHHFVFQQASQQLRYTFVPGRERWSLQVDQRELPEGCWTPLSTFFFER